MLPSKSEIRNYAIKKNAVEQIVRMGSHTAITPEPEEMELRDAQNELMRADKEVLAQQEKYLRDMASDMGLHIVPKKDYERFEKHGDFLWRTNQKLKKALHREKLLAELTGYKWRDGWTRREQKKTVLKQPLNIRITMPKTPRISLPQNKAVMKAIMGEPRAKPKRRRHHVERNGKTMRRLRHVKGVKVFSFPDQIWKVRR